jgi:outer membrane receptor protein involved in Fe transport
MTPLTRGNDTNRPSFTGEVYGINGNGGTAVSKGVELAASVFPTRGLALSLNGAYTDGKLTQDTDPIVGGKDGDPLPYVPKWSGALNADYAEAHSNRGDVLRQLHRLDEALASCRRALAV